MTRYVDVKQARKAYPSGCITFSNPNTAMVEAQDIFNTGTLGMDKGNESVHRHTRIADAERFLDAKQKAFRRMKIGHITEQLTAAASISFFRVLSGFIATLISAMLG